MVSIRGLTCLLLAACVLQHAAANDMFFRATVLDCDDKIVPGKYVSVYGCTDKVGSSAVADNPLESARIDPVEDGVAGLSITDQYLYCPDSWGPPQDNGLKVDYCSGSAQNDCSLAVVKLKEGTTDTYELDTTYDAKVNVLGDNLEHYTRFSTAPDGTYLYQTVARPDYPDIPAGSQIPPCSTAFGVCSRQVYAFRPNNCPVVPPPPPPTCQYKCPGLPKLCIGTSPTRCGYKETAYAIMCAWDKSATTTPSTDYPSFISFNPRQPIYASSPALFSNTQPNNWGWMGQWPKTYLAGGDENCCTVKGYVFAGRKYLAGTVSAFMKASDPPAGSPAGTKLYSLTVSINVWPNRLGELHIYFGCDKLATNAPGQFGPNNWDNFWGLKSTTKTVTAVCPELGDPVLYTAIHMVLN